jgi:hypothetical protein
LLLCAQKFLSHFFNRHATQQAVRRYQSEFSYYIEFSLLLFFIPVDLRPVFGSWPFLTRLSQSRSFLETTESVELLWKSDQPYVALMILLLFNFIFVNETGTDTVHFEEL